MPENEQQPRIDVERYPHLSFEREPDIEPERRRRRSRGTELPPRVRGEHGAQIKDQVAAAASVITPG